MGLLGKILNRAVGPVVDFTIRRFEAAETNRLNRGHWRGAHDQPINVDLYTDLNTLRERSIYEARRNPTVESVINLYSKDVSGREGPMMRAINGNKSKAWNEAFQGLWYDWFQCPDIAGKLGGVDIIRLDVRNLFQCGEFLHQKVTDRTSPGVTLRLKMIHPRRLKTPPSEMGDPTIAMGVKRTPEGKPISYFIMHPLVWQVYQLDIGKYDEIPAESIVHEFITVEDEQVRGYPWISVSLQSTGDSRDFDNEVLDAARAAANQAVYWYTDHPDAPFVEVNETQDMDRRTQETGPPGWKPAMLSPTQPAANYTEFHSEKQRDVGNPVGMPLNMSRLDSSEHNYSGARFDGEIYKRGIACTREWLERRILRPLAMELLREAELYAAANPDWKYAALRRRPKDMEILFIWQPLASVDPEKDAAEEQLRLSNGTRTFDEACAMAGNDEDTQLQKIKETLHKFADAGLPPPPWMTAGLQKIGVKLAPDGSLVPLVPPPSPKAGKSGDSEETQDDEIATPAKTK